MRPPRPVHTEETSIAQWAEQCSIYHGWLARREGIAVQLLAGWISGETVQPENHRQHVKTAIMYAEALMEALDADA